MATKTPENIKNYQEASKRTTSRLNEMKRDCWRHFTSEMSLKTDPQQVFRVINAISGKQTPSTGSALTVNNKTLKGDRSKVEAFCREYASVSRLKLDKADKRRHYQLNEKLKLLPIDQNTGYDSLLTMAELTACIGKPKNGKSPVLDGITNEMIKHLGPIATSALLRLFNLSWETVIVPNSWRRAKIIPIPKKNKPADKIGSYHPISLTSCLAKLMETLVKTRLMYFLESNNLLSNNEKKTIRLISAA